MKELRAQGHTVYYCIADLEAHDSVWETVLENYLQAYGADDKTALVFGIRQSRKAAEALRHMRGKIGEMGEEAPLVLTHPLGEDVSVSALRQADCLITTKDGISSVAVDYASDAGSRIAYGLDSRDIVFPK